MSNGYSQIFETAFQRQKAIDRSGIIVKRWLEPKKERCQCENCINKNTFDDDVYIVIQGHTAQLGEMIANYSGYKNVIWAIDDTDNMRNFDLISSSGINPVVVARPLNPGFGNINLQSVSAVGGLRHAKDLGAKYCIKIRSDMVMKPLETFINAYDFSTLGFLGYVTNPYKHFDKPFEPIDEYISGFANFYDIKEHNITRNYVTDFCLTGPIDDVISFFDYVEEPDNPSAEAVHAPAEFKFLLNYLRKNGYKMDTSREYLKKNFNFFISTLEEEGIDLINIKNNYSNYSNLEMFRES
jgi:hypothetical protein|tara:strand:- start:320 stop:1210 length:891 start_codon:yes stop_codon:yes gene_type:complete